MKLKQLLTVILMVLVGTVNAQQIVRLWEKQSPPTQNGLQGSESLDGDCIVNVSDPTITIYAAPASINTQAAIIICPGGGYGGLAMEHEGKQFAAWLNTQGITGIVLKYRMPNGHQTVPMEDFTQAITYVRAHAKELHINTHKVGVAGFSAGGHLASTASTHYTITETRNTRPDFALLFYPVVTMGENTHVGSKINLLGDKPSVADVFLYSNELHVTANTPKTLLLLSDDDNAVPTINSIQYYNALHHAHVPCTLYIFPEGGHGWGMHNSFAYHNQMLELVSQWLKKNS